MPSPIEHHFIGARHHHHPDLRLVPEYPVYGGRYRLDFAYPPAKVAVELDGYQFHNSRDKFTGDRQRDRALQRDGWRVLHFSGREIHNNVDACVREVFEAIRPTLSTSTASLPSGPTPQVLPCAASRPVQPWDVPDDGAEPLAGVKTKRSIFPRLLVAAALVGLFMVVAGLLLGYLWAPESRSTVIGALVLAAIVAGGAEPKRRRRRHRRKRW